MDMEQNKYTVYVKTDDTGRIVAINSDAFLTSLDGWQKVAEGTGDKFYHAQGNYFPLPIVDENGVFRYKLEDGQPLERTQEEMDADRPNEEAGLSTEDRLEVLETENAQLKEALELILSGEVGADG